MNDSPVMVTGAAGFIGFHVARALLDAGSAVIGVDSMTADVDPKLKQARLGELTGRPGFSFERLDLANRDKTASLFSALRPRRVIHLAAQAGVRNSLENPHPYVDANIVGFLNVLEGCRHNGVQHLTYASSSSVYGADTPMPFAVSQGTDHPASLYGASKRANELMAHCYSHLFALPSTGLRFFTVYGPWGRPDMATFLFTKAIIEGRPVPVFNEGRMRRDFTYIADAVEVVIRISERMPSADPQRADRAHIGDLFKLYNVGNGQAVELMYVIATLERLVGRKAVLNLQPMQPGDVPATCADVADLFRDTGVRPATPIEVGLERFVAWYRDFYKV